MRQTGNKQKMVLMHLNQLLCSFRLIWLGALRTRSDADIQQKFMKAFHEDNLLALKILFYARNIRGGLGERRVFKTILQWLADRHAEIVIANFDNIAKFGRYDDFYIFVETKVEKEAFAFLKAQLEKDG